jgi:hypothetical protein
MEDSPTKKVLIKRIVSFALKEYNSSSFKSDLRMLAFWKLLVHFTYFYDFDWIMIF